MYMRSGGYDPDKPTVLFLHGYIGSANDCMRVRRDHQVCATRVRFCALDRPGNGYSENYSAEGKGHLHFGKVAEATEDVLRAYGVKGDIILMFHSLGSYWAMALAHQVRDICSILQCVAVCCSVLQRVAVCCSVLQRDAVWHAFDRRSTDSDSWRWRIQVRDISNSSDMRFVGGVAIDALATQWVSPRDPRWISWNEPSPEADCNPNAPLHDPYGYGDLWKLIKTLTPTGLVRLLYATGFGNYNVVIKMYPSDVQGAVETYSMSRKFIDTAILETERWDINCGYAKAGEGVFAELVAFELIVVPKGLNLSALALLNPRSNVTIAQGPKENEHSGILLHKDYAPIVAQALLRVIRKVEVHLTET